MTNKTSVIKNLRNDAFIQFSEQHGSRLKLSLLNERLNTKQELLSVYLKCNICITFLFKRYFCLETIVTITVWLNHHYISRRKESRIFNSVGK